jgi:hypothetical protein
MSFHRGFLALLDKLTCATFVAFVGGLAYKALSHYGQCALSSFVIAHCTAQEQ